MSKLLEKRKQIVIIIFILAGVSWGFGIARWAIGTNGSFRRTLWLLIGPRSVASVSRTGALTGPVRLLPVDSRIRRRNHRRAVGHHHHRRRAWSRLRKIITIDGNHLTRCQMNSRTILRMLFPAWSSLVSIRFRTHQSLLQLSRIPRFVRSL